MHRRVLFAMELGANFGHLSRCLALARRCRDEGLQVLLASPDLGGVAKVVAGEGVRLLQAPLLPFAAQGPRPINYAGLLLRRGFSDVEGLKAAVAGWLGLFDLVSPEAIICDHAPTALLALKISKLHGIVTGSAIEIPAAGASLPSFLPLDVPAPALDEGLADFLIGNINSILSGYGADNFTRIDDLFADIPKFIFGFPALDPSGYRADVRYLGALREFPVMPKGHWRGGGRPKVLVYLRRETPEMDDVVGHLARIGADVLLVGTDKDQRPICLSEIVPAADLVITHGSDLVIRALSEGVPSLVVPRTVEQFYCGLGIEKIRCGATLKEEGVANQIDLLLADREVRGRANAFSIENKEKFYEHRAEHQWSALMS